MRFSETVPLIPSGIQKEFEVEPQSISAMFSEAQTMAIEERTKEEAAVTEAETIFNLAPDFVLSNSEGDDIVINSILVEYVATPWQKDHQGKCPTDAIKIDDITFRPREGITGARIYYEIGNIREDVIPSDGKIQAVTVTIQGCTFQCNTEWLIMLRDPEFRNAMVAKTKEAWAQQQREMAEAEEKLRASEEANVKREADAEHGIES